MLTQIRLELFKLVRRPRSYLGFGALGVMSGLVVLGLALGGEESIRPGSIQALQMIGSIRNGAFVAWMMLVIPPSSQFMLPLFSCAVSGDMVSGESADGTLRSLLSRPIKRGTLFGAKFIASVLYVFALTFFLGLSAYLIGRIFLGHGALVTLGTPNGFTGELNFFGNDAEAAARLAMAYAFAAFATLSVAALAFLISALISNSLGAIGGAMMIMIMLQITQAIPYFNSIQPYLFTHHMNTASDFFSSTIPWAEVGKSAGVLLAYIAGFFSLGLIIFNRRDVLS